jgi:hypothetical protein
MCYELNPDTFETGKAYRIKIHRQEIFSRVVEVSLCPDDDVVGYDINTAYKKLYNRLDKTGIDAICIKVSNKYVEFITSTRNLKLDIVTMTIRITLDDILAANESKNAGVTPAIEIL